MSIKIFFFRGFLIFVVFVVIFYIFVVYIIVGVGIFIYFLMKIFFEEVVEYWFSLVNDGSLFYIIVFFFWWSWYGIFF